MNTYLVIFCVIVSMCAYILAIEGNLVEAGLAMAIVLTNINILMGREL